MPPSSFRDNKMKISVLFFILAIVTSAYASVLPVRAPALKVYVLSETDFCSFLPREPGENIGESEDDAIPFCTKSNPDTPGVNIFPSGFIKSANFAKGDGFVQITGTIHREKYDLKKSDGGGQYDTKAPNGASCVGFKKFVNLIEPDDEIFCIRCCTDPKKCDTGRSTDGCKSIIRGDYN